MSASVSMMVWCSRWKLDGDVCRCSRCGRGIIITRSNEPLHHAAFCEGSENLFPWDELKKALEEAEPPTPEATRG